MDIALLQLIAASGLTIIAVYYLVPVLIKIAYIRELYDTPDGERKIHAGYISSLGGVAIFTGLFTGFALSGFTDYLSGYGYFAAAIFVLFLTGLKDDLIGLSPYKKLIIEIVTVLLVMTGAGALITDFSGLFGIGPVPVYVALPVTAFTIIVVMNSFNLIDGIDGLAGGIGAIAALFFSGGFLLAGSYALAALSFITAAALFGFLMHNFHPAKIFMGDSGSLVVGFVLAFLAVHFIGLHANPAFELAFGNSGPALAVSFLMIPLYDTFTVFIKRIQNGVSPFRPGRDHLHHRLLRMGFSHSQTSLILYLIAFMVSILSISLSSFNIHITLAGTILFAVFLLPTVGIKRSLLKKTGLFNFEAYMKRQKLMEELKRGKETEDATDEEEMIRELSLE